jgi:hypothetical protein
MFSQQNPLPTAEQVSFPRLAVQSSSSEKNSCDQRNGKNVDVKQYITRLDQKEDNEQLKPRKNSTHEKDIEERRAGE